MHERRGPVTSTIKSTSLLVLALGVALLVVSQPLAQQLSGDLGGDLSAAVLRGAIEQTLTVAPRGFERLVSPAQAGVRVNRVNVERVTPRLPRVRIDLSQRALTYDPSGDGELLTDQILSSLAPHTTAAGDVTFQFTVDGLPLDQFVPQPAPPRLRTRELQPRGPLVISAGHGWYWNETWGWLLQRDHFWGIVEDVVNWEIARYVLDELSGARIGARAARHPDATTGVGISGRPQWQESAKYFIRSLGAPPNVSDFGRNEYNRDINSRPFYANWVDATALVSIHNNGGGGTGTETWYDETNGQAYESRRLAQIVNDAVVQAIRAHYDPNWPDRGLRSCNGCKGETRLAARPAIILEVAFMDMAWPDNAALHDDRFKRIVAQAVREGLQAWGGMPATPAPPPDDFTKGF